jgi:hypothetical protein
VTTRDTVITDDSQTTNNSAEIRTQRNIGATHSHTLAAFDKEKGRKETTGGGARATSKKRVKRVNSLLHSLHSARTQRTAVCSAPLPSSQTRAQGKRERESTNNSVLSRLLRSGRNAQVFFSCRTERERESERERERKRESKQTRGRSSDKSLSSPLFCFTLRFTLCCHSFPFPFFSAHFYIRPFRAPICCVCCFIRLACIFSQCALLNRAHNSLTHDRKR